MNRQPVRAAVISDRHLVRAGLTHTFAETATRTLVTCFAHLQDRQGHHDLVIYDVEEGSRARIDVRRLSGDRALLALLVHEAGGRETFTALTPGVETLSLSATAATLEALLHRVLASPSWAERPHQPLPHDLSDRELEVLELIASGLSNEEISNRLYLSINSVKTYVRQAYRKVGVRGRVGALRWALDRGVGIGPGDNR